MGKPLEFDVNEMTLGDMEYFEELTGEDLLEALKPEVVIDPVTNMPQKDPDSDRGEPLLRPKLTAKRLRGLAWVALKRDNPDATIEDLRKVKLTDVSGGAKADPTSAQSEKEESASESV